MPKPRSYVALFALIALLSLAGCGKPVISVVIEKSTNGQDADVGKGPEILVGDPVTWTYTITNKGTVTLEQILVTDDDLSVSPAYKSGDANADNKLQTTEAWVYEASGVALSGQYENVGRVRAVYEGKDYYDMDFSHYFGRQRLASVTLRKETNGSDANSEPGPYIIIGQQVVWSYRVENTGEVDLNGIVVTDDKGIIPVKVGGDDTDDILSPGEAWLFRAEGVAQAGQYSNIGKVEAYYGAQKVEDTDPSHYFGAAGPAIGIVKKTNGVDANSQPGPSVGLGEPVTWTYEVKNEGDVPLEDVAVTDDKGITPVYSSGDDGDGVLEVGETWVYSASGVAASGQYSNTGTAEGWFEGIKVSDSDLSHYFGVAPASIDMEKWTNGEDADTEGTSYQASVGDAITWQYRIENTGGFDLAGVLVSDDKESPAYKQGDLNLDGILNPGELWIYEATGVAQLGHYSNTGSVEAWAGPTKVADSDMSHYDAQGAPALTTWEFDFMQSGVEAVMADESWLVDGGTGENSLGLWLNSCTVAPPMFFTGDFTAEYYFYPRASSDDPLYRMSFRIWNNQYATNSLRRYVAFSMYYLGDTDTAYYQVDQGNGSYTYNEYDGYAPGIKPNDINVCVFEKTGDRVEIYLNGFLIKAVTILPQNAATGYAPMLHGHSSWDMADSNLFIRKVKVTYMSDEYFFDEW